jgi:hypothetical protein
MLAKFANTLPWGWKLLDEKLDVDDVSPPLEDMMRNHPSYVALSTCDLPTMWETLDQLEMAMDWCVLYKHNEVYHQHHNRYNIFAIVYSLYKGECLVVVWVVAHSDVMFLVAHSPWWLITNHWNGSWSLTNSFGN